MTNVINPAPYYKFTVDTIVSAVTFVLILSVEYGFLPVSSQDQIKEIVNSFLMLTWMGISFRMMFHGIRNEPEGKWVLKAFLSSIFFPIVYCFHQRKKHRWVRMGSERQQRRSPCGDCHQWIDSACICLRRHCPSKKWTEYVFRFLQHQAKTSDFESHT